MWSCLLFWLVVWNTLDVIKSNKTKDFIRCYKDHMVFTLHAKLYKVYKVQSLRSPTRSNCRVFIFHVLQIIDSSQLEQLLTYSMPREDILSWLYWSAHNIWGMLYLLIVNCIFKLISNGFHIARISSQKPQVVGSHVSTLFASRAVKLWNTRSLLMCFGVCLVIV